MLASALFSILGVFFVDATIGNSSVEFLAKGSVDVFRIELSIEIANNIEPKIYTKTYEERPAL